MKYLSTLSVTASVLGLLATTGTASAQQTGSVLSDLSNPEVIAKHRAEAEERIACPVVDGYRKQMAAFSEHGMAKWDRAAMGCAIEYGSDAVRDLSIPSSALWAFVTFRADNIETALEVLGAHLEYFDVLDKAYGAHYQGIEQSSELGLRWERTHASGQEILDRVNPLVPAIPEARIVRAAFNLASTMREATPEQESAALVSALEDLSIAIEEKPEALDGVGQLVMGQVMVALPEFLGGDALAGIELLETANTMNPSDITVHMSLVEAYLGERENDKAIALLQAALDVDPETNHPQDYVDETKHLGGLALRTNHAEIAAAFAEKREAILAAQPQLLSRTEHASFGHGGEDPITGEKPDALTSN